MVIISKNPEAKLHYNEYVWPVDNTQSVGNDKLSEVRQAPNLHPESLLQRYFIFPLFPILNLEDFGLELWTRTDT